MTLATLNEMFNMHGSYGETLRGREYHILTNDRNRSVVGPARHRKRSLMSFGKKRQKPDLSQTIQYKIYADSAPSNETVDLSQFQEVGEAVTQAFRMPTAPCILPPAPPQNRVWGWLKDKWYDREWHEGARNTAGTVLIWSFTAASAVVLLKGLAWVLFL